MKTISQIVESIIVNQAFLAEALVEGLINVSSLARKIQPQVEEGLKKEVKAGAIIMALNRLIPNIEVKVNNGISDLLNSLRDIIVRSHLVDYTYKNSDSLIERHTELLKAMGSKQEYFYTMVQGVFESNLVVSSTLSEKVEAFFKNESLICKNTNLSAVTLKLPAANIRQPGFYYYILKSIAWVGINIQEVISTTNEFTIVVNEEDIDKTFSVLTNLNK